MPRCDTDVAYVFGGRTWGEHLVMKRKQNCAPRRPCACLRENCKGIWLECWGEKNVPHIRRCPEQEGLGSCGMTIDHANAQAGMAGLLETGKQFTVQRECVRCGRVRVQTISLSEGEECRQEAFFRNERNNFADLGILPKGAKRGTRPTMIIEILHSSATLEENRPKDIPWFEIKAEDVNQQTELAAKDPLFEFSFHCQRKLVCDECVAIGPVIAWIRAKDKGTPGDMWNKQYYSKCVGCDRLCEHQPRCAPPGQYDIQNASCRGSDYLYTLHRMCKYHRELMESGNLIFQREFLVAAAECYADRCKRIKDRRTIEARRRLIIEAERRRLGYEAAQRLSYEAERRRLDYEDERRRINYEAACVAAVEQAEHAQQIAQAKRISEACKATGPHQLALAKRVLAVARRVAETKRRLADQRIAKYKRAAHEEQADHRQRRLDYVAACVAERDYYERKESGSLTKKLSFRKKTQASALARPSHERYLMKNKWITGMKEYFAIP
jgi:hypothetical protein